MLDGFDRRVVSDDALSFIRTCQASVPCSLAGGVALSGAFLAHRGAGNIDLHCNKLAHVRELHAGLGGFANSIGAKVRIVRDMKSHVRAELQLDVETTIVDLAHQPSKRPDEPDLTLEGVLVRPVSDLHASKIACLVSRSEPRDLVDLCFLEQAGQPPEPALLAALNADAAIDPAALAWLLRTFPLQPVPPLFGSFTEGELAAYRDNLAERLRAAAVPAR